MVFLFPLEPMTWSWEIGWHVPMALRVFVQTNRTTEQIRHPFLFSCRLCLLCSLSSPKTTCLYQLFEPGSTSPDFSHLLVTKRRKGQPECVAPRATEAPVNVLYGTLRRPTERNAVRVDHCADAVEGV